MMKAQLSVLDFNIKISATLKEVGVPFPNTDKEDKTLHNQFEIKVEVHSPANGAEVHRFDFYDSHHNYSAGRQQLDDLFHPLDCLMSDAMCGLNDFEEFCSELGYDEDSRRAERIHEACKEQAAAAEILFAGHDLYDVANEIREAIEHAEEVAAAQMDEEEVIISFEANILPGIIATYEQDGTKDIPARREAFNNYTDSLCKDGQISEELYNNICLPDRLEE